MTTFVSALDLCLPSHLRIGMVASGVEEGIYAVNLTEPCFMVLVKSGQKCSMWKVSLADDIISKHAEEDVGVSDPSGVSSFATYFHSAMGKLLHVENLAGKYPADPESNTLSIRLDYQIGSMQIDGFLSLNLVQGESSIDYYNMMKILYTSDPTRMVYSSTRYMPLDGAGLTGYLRTAPSSSAASTVHADVTSGGTKAVEDDSNVDDDVAIVKAKKRKATGVNLFNAKKR